MNARTAPCTRCGSLILFGMRACRKCGATFDYGASPPPEPTQAEIIAALGPMDGVRPAAASNPGIRPAAQSNPGVRPAAQPNAGVRPAAQPNAATRPAAQPNAGVRSAAQQRAQPPMSSGQGAPMATPPAAGGGDMASFLDTGRFDGQAEGPVQTEAIEGFIDSSLFAQYTPETVDTEVVEGLEQTGFQEVGDVATEALPVEHTSVEAAPDVPVQAEAIEGFIDSSLFAHYTPATVETEAIEGFEGSPSAQNLRPTKPRKAANDDDLYECTECGLPHDKTVCPSCGARRRGEG